MARRMMPWPPLPDLVAKQLEALAAEDEESEESEGSEGEPARQVDEETGEILPRVVRPWDLNHLQGDLEAAVWSWLDDVVMWLNYTYAWQDDQVIPACYPEHEGLALDLAALAFGRLDAYETTTAAYVGRWHSDWEDLQRRMGVALGESGRDCRRGKHVRPSQYTVDAVMDAINRDRDRAARKAARGGD